MVRRRLASRQSKAASAMLLAVAVTGVSWSCTPAVWEAAAAGLAAGAAAQPSYYGAPAHDERVCAKYQTTTGWSKGYSVEGTVMKGSELNRRTRTYDYDAFATYVVIFWGQGQASILKLDYYFGSIPVTGVDATDRRGVRWSVSRATYCY